MFNFFFFVFVNHEFVKVVVVSSLPFYKNSFDPFHTGTVNSRSFFDNDLSLLLSSYIKKHNIYTINLLNLLNLSYILKSHIVKISFLDNLKTIKSLHIEESTSRRHSPPTPATRRLRANSEKFLPPGLTFFYWIINLLRLKFFLKKRKA